MVMNVIVHFVYACVYCGPEAMKVLQELSCYPSNCPSSQNPEMCQHLADNVQRTMQHAIEVEEKIPLDQVRLSVCVPGLSVSLIYSNP